MQADTSMLACRLPQVCGVMVIIVAVTVPMLAL